MRRLLPDTLGGRIVLVLLVATVISALEWLLQDPQESALPYEAIVILAIVVLNAMLADGCARLRASSSCRDGRPTAEALREDLAGKMIRLRSAIGAWRRTARSLRSTGAAGEGAVAL